MVKQMEETIGGSSSCSIVCLWDLFVTLVLSRLDYSCSQLVFVLILDEFIPAAHPAFLLFATENIPDTPGFSLLGEEYTFTITLYRLKTECREIQHPDPIIYFCRHLVSYPDRQSGKTIDNKNKIYLTVSPQRVAKIRKKERQTLDDNYRFHVKQTHTMFANNNCMFLAFRRVSYKFGFRLFNLQY